MCLYSRLVPNKRYTANGKNGGIIPAAYDKRALAVPAKCGHCMECRKAKARDWQIRLTEDIKANKGAQMITLTFSTEALKHIGEHKRKWLDRKTGEIRVDKIKDLQGYERDNAICKRAIRLFTERWRRKHGKSIRHWLVSELGHENTEHVHLHGIVWGNTHEVEKIWNSGKVKFGFVWKGKMNWRTMKLENYVNGKTIGYTIKYISKMDMIHQLYNPIILSSHEMGKNFLKQKNMEQKFNYDKTKDYYRTETGHKIGMPAYWRKQLYTDEEREAMWMDKLNKNIRWIDGQKVDLNRVNEQEYYKTLTEAQNKSKKLGYRDGTGKWKREVYEKERRNLIWEYRMKLNRSEAGHSAKGRLTSNSVTKKSKE